MKLRLAHKEVIFHRDNTSAHTSTVAMAKWHELKFELHHLPYFPDLVLCDFFPILKLQDLVWRKEIFVQ